MRTASIIILTIASVMSNYSQRSERQEEFYKAISSGDIAAVRKLLQIDASLAKTNDRYSYRPLHWAAWGGRTDIGELLIQSGADVNAKAYGAFATHNYTALHVAASKGHKEFVELLLKKGADVNAQNTEVEAFRGDNWAMTPMHSAVIGGNIFIVKALIEKNARVDEPNHGNLRPLYYAAADGKLDIVRLLLKHKADVNAKARQSIFTRGDHTALHTAALNGHAEVVKALIESEADVYAKARDGKTALDEAREKGHPVVVKLIENAMKSK